MHSVHVRQTIVNYLTLVLAATVTKMDWSPINARSANSYFAWFCFPLDFSTTLLAHVFHLFLFLSKTERLSKPLLFTKRGAAGRFLEVHRINWFVFGSVYLFVEIQYENTKIHKKLYQASREQEKTHTPCERSLSVKAHVAEKLSFYPEFSRITETNAYVL